MLTGHSAECIIGGYVIKYHVLFMLPTGNLTTGRAHAYKYSTCPLEDPQDKVIIY